MGAKPESGLDVTKKVVVAVKASKEIPRASLVWALTHVVQPGDCITLLVVVPSHSSGKRLWVFPRFAEDCASGHRRSHSGTTLEQKFDIIDSCSQMMLQLHDVYDPNKIKVIPGSPSGAVAAESNIAQASWVVLDRQLKQEKKRCVEELQCNIVTMKRSQPKVLRLNIIGSPKGEPEVVSSIPPTLEEAYTRPTKDSHESLHSIRGPVVTPTSSPEQGIVFTATEVGTSSVSSSDPGMSPFLVFDLNGGLKKADSNITVEAQKLDITSSDSDNENLSPPSTSLDF